MNSKRNNLTKSRFLAVIVVLFLTVLTIQPLFVQAADLVNRSIQLGSSFASDNTTHEYDFTTVTPGIVGSIQFQYCSNSPLFSEPCTAPAGLNVMSAGVLSESGITGFSVSGASTPTNLIITRTPQAESPTSSSYVFDNIINPSSPNEVVYVRISVFDNENGTGNLVDSGATVFVTEERFNVDAYVPPYLTFCVGVTVALDCSEASGFLADFGEFSPDTPTTVTSQMSVATNDPNGYNLFVNGQTLLSGSNIIPALSTQTASQPGTSQFGINLRNNTNPSVGSNPQDGSVANGSPASNYNSPNQFRYVDGERVAGSPQSTGFNRYTTSYMVNVASEQAPGVYASTFTYTAIATF